MSQILDNLYLGRQLDAKNKDFITKSKITHVFNCAWEAQYKLSKEIKYFEMKLKDQQNFPIIEYLDQAADHINKVLNEERGVLFVHCVWGVSRSPTLVIAYLMKYHNWNCLDAREFVRNKRPEISPNKSFWRTLQGYCEKLHPEILKEKHVHEVCTVPEAKKEVKEGRDSIRKTKSLAMKEKKIEKVLGERERRKI